MKRLDTYLLASATLICLPARAMAQSTVTPAPAGDVAAAKTKKPGDPVGLGDIVVTAQRRAERLQDVPISITTATSDQLSTARVVNVSNISAISPSAQIRTGNNPTASVNLIIRGLGTTGASRTFEGAVGVFIDGVYRTRAAAALQNFLDIDNLQLLKGPQGTLFGKNTSAGALLLTSASPNLNRVEGRYEVGYGNYDFVIARGGVSVPLSDNAAIRIAGLYSKRSGFFNDPNTGKDLNNDETYAVKGQFLFEPTSTLRIRLIGDYSRSHGNCCYATADFINGRTQPIINGLIVAAGLKVPSSRQSDFQQSLNGRNNQIVKDYGSTALVDFEIGSDTIKSVTALRRFQAAQVGSDADFSAADVSSLDESFDGSFFSQEITYNGKIVSPSASYTLGAYFSDEKINIIRNFYWGTQAQAFWNSILPPGFVAAPPGLWDVDKMRGTSKSYAAFAHFDFKLGLWNLIAGARFSREQKTGAMTNPFYSPLPNDVFRRLGVLPGPAYNQSRTDSALSGTLGVQYHVARDAMIYLTYNRGFKAGGVNIDANGAGQVANNPAETPGGVPLSAAFKPETVDAVELGTKIEYFNRRARANIAVFYNKISDLQVGQFIGNRFSVLNAKSAETYGLEIENLFKITNAISLGLDGIWLPRAQYGHDASIDPTLSDHRFRFAPKFTGNLTLNLDQPVTTDLSVTGRAQYQYSGSQLLNTASLAQRGGTSIKNINLGLASKSGNWQLEGWVQNLFNKTYVERTFNTPFQGGDQNAFMGAPRTIGVTFRGKF